jgi:predicted DsbA family dithiol-disulfide isomerase
MIEKLENSFAEVGIKYNHEGGQRDELSRNLADDTSTGLTANTLDAHRLIEWAQEKGTRKQRDALVENLFHFYFAEAKNVGDLSVLADAAEKSGLDRTEAEAVLKSDEYERNIDQKMWINQTKGIPGVPTFVFQGK